MDRLRTEIVACDRCAGYLPHGPRPVAMIRPAARLLIIGQAPGTRVHKTGIPWNDPSGDRLRDWLALDRQTFYGSARLAIMPMGFCYPGTAKSGGDKPPRPECAPTWHDRALAMMPDVALTLLVGGYAQHYYLGPHDHGTVAENVEKYREFLPRFMPLPHPSWRTTGWRSRNPWFERDVLPTLRVRVSALLGSGPAAAPCV